MWERQLRAVLCWAVFFVMIAFYLPVVAAIQALLQVSLLSLTPYLEAPIFLLSFFLSPYSWLACSRDEDVKDRFATIKVTKRHMRIQALRDISKVKRL